MTLDNEETLYFANASLGTPPQELRLHVDTGSSDLWTNSALSDVCQLRGDPCAESGTYNANRSTSYRYVSSDFNISYQDGSAALGDYARDTIRMGQTNLAGLQFGIGYRSSSQQSILGIGYSANEVQVNRNGKEPYANLPQLMKDEGLIRSVAYSLWLNDLDASTGSILFGGVNTDKFRGPLQTLPIQTSRTRSAPSEFVITLTGVSFNQGGNQREMGGSDREDPVLLDSGSSLMYLPNEVVSDIYDAIDAEYDQEHGNAYVACSIANNDATLRFTFTSPSIDVPMNELVIDPGQNRDGSRPALSDGTTPACLFGIAPAGDGTSVLGDTFLRSAYVVYDLSNNQISIAQTNFNATTDNIREIGTGSGAVPDATLVPNVKASSPTQYVGGRLGGAGTTGIATGALSSPTDSAGLVEAAPGPRYMMAGLAGAAVLMAL
ncbi:MAG: hypothetical protein M1837_001738 [Sclerophora amabilis]|nr:MAG: hypothetical protein M1837_001738 [Sclerophora amabilis]